MAENSRNIGAFVQKYRLLLFLGIAIFCTVLAYFVLTPMHKHAGVAGHAVQNSVSFSATRSGNADAPLAQSNAASSTASHASRPAPERYEYPVPQDSVASLEAVSDSSLSAPISSSSALSSLAPSALEVRYNGALVLTDRDVEPDILRPRLAIIIDDIGESMPAVKRLAALSYPVIFSVWPYATHTTESAEFVHKLGFEVMIHQPMEPIGYPKVKPGEGCVFVSMSAADIEATIRHNLTLVPHAVGINNHMGSGFTQNTVAVRAALKALANSRLFIVDSLTYGKTVLAREAALAGFTTYRRNIFLDVVEKEQSILQQLDKAAALARKHGTAIAIGHPIAETLNALEAWQRRVPHDVQIVFSVNALR